MPHGHFSSVTFYKYAEYIIFFWGDYDEMTCWLHEELKQL